MHACSLTSLNFTNGVKSFKLYFVKNNYNHHLQTSVQGLDEIGSKFRAMLLLDDNTSGKKVHILCHLEILTFPFLKVNLNKNLSKSKSRRVRFKSKKQIKACQI